MKSNHHRLTPLIAGTRSPASQHVRRRRSVVKRHVRRLERRIWTKTVREWIQDVCSSGPAKAGAAVVTSAN